MDGMTLPERVTIRLRQRYTEWVKPDPAPGKTQIPYLRWKDDGARAAYYLLCEINKIPKEC